MIKDDIVRHKAAHIIILFFLAVNSGLGGLEWWAAPANASDGFEDTASRQFVPLAGNKGLEGLLTTDEGWYWLRASLEGRDGAAILVSGAHLAWSAWLGDKKMAESGSGPPRWKPSLPIPALVRLDEGMRSEIDLYLKIYLRRGYGTIPEPPLVGGLEFLRRRQMLIIARDFALPILTVILGLLLFLGGIAASSRIKKFGRSPLTFFGLLTAIAYSGPLLLVIPGLTTVLSWTLAELITLGAWPLALSLWRRVVIAMDDRNPPLLSLLDWIIAVAVAAWMILQQMASPIDTRIARLLLIDPRAYYIGLSIAVAVVVWIVQTAQRRTGRTTSLLILLAGVAPSLLFIVAGSPPLDFAESFITHGLPAAVFLSLPLLTSRRSDSDIKAVEPLQELIAREELDEPEAMTSIEEIPEEPAAQFESPIDGASPVGIDDALRRGLRSSLYPECLPWDRRWDAAAARQGYRHPSTGFYDIYAGNGKAIRGFSFLNSSSDDLESLIFAHSVREELQRLGSTSVNLSRTARIVHRRATNTTHVTGPVMKGFIGAFKDENLVLLPLAMPPLVLKRRRSGKIFSLQPLARRASNPPMGHADFLGANLQTVGVPMNSGDTLLMFTSELVELRSSSTGEEWGVRRLAESLGRETARSAQEVASTLIQDLKDFADVDELEGPIQLLVIRRR